MLVQAVCLKEDFLDRFKPVSSLVETTIKDSLSKLSKIVQYTSELDFRSDKEKVKEYVDHIITAVEWLNNINSILDNELASSDMYLFNDDYEVVMKSGMMKILKSKYKILIDGKEVLYLGPECFSKSPEVEYVCGV